MNESDTGLICLLRRLQSWLEGQSIMLHSVMEPVVVLRAVMPLHPKWCNIYFFFLTWMLSFLQYTMSGLMGGRSFPAMTLESSTISTILLNQQQWSKRWVRYPLHEGGTDIRILLVTPHFHLTLSMFMKHKLVCFVS